MAKGIPSEMTGFSTEERQNKRWNYKENLKKTEDTIRDKPVEHMIMVDSKGNIKFQTTDNKVDEVSFTMEMAKNAVDAVVTHNHPGGSCFSPEDIQSALYYGVREIRATTAKNGTHVLRRNYELSEGAKLVDALYFPSAYYEYRITKVVPAVKAMIARKEIPFDLSAIRREESKLLSKWLTDNAGKYGWSYTKEE